MTTIDVFIRHVGLKWVDEPGTPMTTFDVYKTILDRDSSLPTILQLKQNILCSVWNTLIDTEKGKVEGYCPHCFTPNLVQVTQNSDSIDDEKRTRTSCTLCSWSTFLSMDESNSLVTLPLFSSECGLLFHKQSTQSQEISPDDLLTLTTQSSEDEFQDNIISLLEGEDGGRIDLVFYTSYSTFWVYRNERQSISHFQKRLFPDSVTHTTMKALKHIETSDLDTYTVMDGALSSKSGDESITSILSQCKRRTEKRVHPIVSETYQDDDTTLPSNMDKEDKEKSSPIDETKDGDGGLSRDLGVMIIPNFEELFSKSESNPSIGSVTLKLSFPAHQLSSNHHIRLLTLFHLFQTSDKPGKGIQRISYITPTSELLIRVSKNYNESIRWSGAKKNWVLLYAFDPKCYAWVSISPSYKIKLDMHVESTVTRITPRTFLNNIRVKYNLLKKEILSVIEREILLIPPPEPQIQQNQQNQPGSEYKLPFSIRTSIVYSITILTNTPRPVNDIIEYVSDSTDYKMIKMNSQRQLYPNTSRTPIIFYHPGDIPPDDSSDYNVIQDAYDWISRNGVGATINEYSGGINKKQRFLLTELFGTKPNPSSSGINRFLYQKLHRGVFVHSTLSYSSITYYNVVFSDIGNILREYTNLYSFLTKKKESLSGNNQLNKFLPQYTNMKRQNINQAKIKEIEEITGSPYEHHDLQDTPRILLRKDELLNIYTPSKQKYLPQYVSQNIRWSTISVDNLMTSVALYTIPMYVHDSLDSFLNSPTESNLFHAQNLHDENKYDEIYRTMNQKKKNTLLEEHVVTPKLVASILWNKYTLSTDPEQWKSEMSMILDSYLTQHVLYKSTRLFLTSSQNENSNSKSQPTLTEKETVLLKSWMDENNHDPTTYWKSSDFFWINKRSYMTKDRYGDWRYIVSRMVRRLTTYYPLVLLYLILSVHLRILYKSKKTKVDVTEDTFPHLVNLMESDLSEEESELHEHKDMSRLLNQVTKSSDKPPTFLQTSKLLSGVLQLIYICLKSDVRRKDRTNVNLTKAERIIREFYNLNLDGDTKSTPVPFDEEHTLQIDRLLKYISSHKNIYFTEYSYEKRNTGLFDDTLKTNSKLHKLFSYKGKKKSKGYIVGDEFMFGLMYYDFLGFLKYYKKNPTPPPSLRHTIFTVSTTSNSSYQDTINHFRTLSIRLEGYSTEDALSGGIVSSTYKGYQYMKTMNNRHPFRYHMIDQTKYGELHALLYSSKILSKKRDHNQDFYAVPVEPSLTPFLDIVLYQIYKKKSNSENQQLFLTRLKQTKDRLNEVLPTIHGGYIPSTHPFPDKEGDDDRVGGVDQPNPNPNPIRSWADVFLDQLQNHPEKIPDDFLWSLLSIPGFVTPGVTYDIFYLKQTEQTEYSDTTLEFSMNPFYHPDTYDESESHTPLIILEIEQTNILFTIRKGVSISDPFHLGEKPVSMLYEWLRSGGPKGTGMYPKVHTYAQYLSLFPPKYYNYTVKTIQKKLKRDITKVVDSNRIVIYILIHLTKTNMIIPVIPHVCYNPIWKKKPYLPEMRPRFEQAMGYLTTMATDQIGFPMYTPKSFLYDSKEKETYITGIQCKHGLVLECLPELLNPSKHTLPLVQRIVYNRMNQYLSTTLSSTDPSTHDTDMVHSTSGLDLSFHRDREYYYHKTLYHISMNPCVIYDLEFTKEQLRSVYDYLPQQNCNSGTDGVDEKVVHPGSIYYASGSSDSDHKKEDWNRYDTPLRIPTIHKEWVQSRLMYEVITGSLPWVKRFVQTKQVMPVKNPYHFRTLDHEYMLYAKRF